MRLRRSGRLAVDHVHGVDAARAQTDHGSIPGIDFGPTSINVTAYCCAQKLLAPTSPILVGAMSLPGCCGAAPCMACPPSTFGHACGPCGGPDDGQRTTPDYSTRHGVPSSRERRALAPCGAQLRRDSVRCRCVLPPQLAPGISTDDRRFAPMVLGVSGYADMMRRATLCVTGMTWFVRIPPVLATPHGLCRSHAFWRPRVLRQSHERRRSSFVRRSYGFACVSG